MKITQTMNGYKDADQFGVVVCFTISGQSYSAYVDFHDRAPHGDLMEISDEKDNAVMFEEAFVERAILEAARSYIRRYRDEVPKPSDLLTKIVPDAESDREQSFLSKLKSVRPS